MARIGIFVDLSNLYYCTRQKFRRKLNYLRYKEFLTGRHELVRAYAYGAQEHNEADIFLDCLKSFGYTPKYKKPKAFENPNFRIDIEAFEEVMKTSQMRTLDQPLIERAGFAFEEVRRALRSKKDIKKADWDVGMAIDIVRLINRVDIVVLGTADGDLAPLVEWVREQQCKCIVCACNIARELRDTADEVIEIEEHLLEGR